MSLNQVARHIQNSYCTEDVTLLYTPIQDASLPYQEPESIPEETDFSFKAGVNPMAAKASTGAAGLQIPADFSALVLIEDFTRRTGFSIDPLKLDWLLHCRIRIRGALCSITHVKVTGPGSIWLTLFATREQV